MQDQANYNDMYQTIVNQGFYMPEEICESFLKEISLGMKLPIMRNECYALTHQFFSENNFKTSSIIKALKTS